MITAITLLVAHRQEYKPLSEDATLHHAASCWYSCNWARFVLTQEIIHAVAQLLSIQICSLILGVGKDRGFMVLAKKQLPQKMYV